MDLPRRVSVVGSTGTGKTTCARQLAAVLRVPHVELDALAWEPNWTLADVETLQTRVRDATRVDRWVVDGNYGGRGVRQIVWDMADTIVWLDFSLMLILRRLWTRTNSRIRDQKELWPGTGNRESFRGAYLSRESMYWWAVKTYRLRRRNYEALFALPQYAHITRLRFRTPAEADRWLERLRAAARI